MSCNQFRAVNISEARSMYINVCNSVLNIHLNEDKIHNMPAMQEADLVPKRMPCDKQTVPIQAAADLL